MKALVSYDFIADEFSENRTRFMSSEYPAFKYLLGRLGPKSRILDAGCGSGVPIARFFSKNGHDVFGFDLSERIIQLARDNVPSAHFESSCQILWKFLSSLAIGP